jgi:Flp pilus assembly protein TadG
MGLLSRFRRNTRGGVALIMGLSAPVVVLGVAATVEYGNVALRRTQLQNAADNAALAAASELTLANSDIYVKSLAEQTAFTAARATSPAITRVTAEIQNKRSWVKVDITETVKSVIGKVLTLPSSEVSVSATGQIVGNTRICLLSLDEKAKDTLHLHKGARITAESCALYANSSSASAAKIETDAVVTASLLCSAGGIEVKSATINAEQMTDCPAKGDPLAGRAPPFVSGCDHTKLVIDGSKTPTASLMPGRYCGGLTITKGAQVTLMSGVYAIDDGPLKVEKDGSLKGEYVGFYFMGDAGGLVFDPKSTIDLSAPKDGAMAGLLFFENRTVNSPVEPLADLLAPAPLPPLGSIPMRTYRIVSDNARNLLGTIYLPAGRLVIDAKRPVADRSAYTIIVARQVDLHDGPNLYLNTNYSGTDVPVPQGVGPTSQRGISLVR